MKQSIVTAALAFALLTTAASAQLVIREIEPVATIVQRLESEYERAGARFRSRTGGRT